MHGVIYDFYFFGHRWSHYVILLSATRLCKVVVKWRQSYCWDLVIAYGLSIHRIQGLFKSRPFQDCTNHDKNDGENQAEKKRQLRTLHLNPSVWNALDTLWILHNIVFLVAFALYVYNTRKSQVKRNTTMCKLHKVSKGLCCYVPLIPTTPLTAAGIRIDPPPSVPKATGHRPEKNRIIENSHWLLPFVIEQTPTLPPPSPSHPSQTHTMNTESLQCYGFLALASTL